MQQLHRTLDPYPNYSPAGIKTQYAPGGASICIQPLREDLNTPERLVRFRKSYKNAPGQTITHYGKVHDALPPQNFIYGKKSADSDHVAQVLKDEALEGLKGYMRNIKEINYASNQKEPLAQTVNRNYKWPERIDEKDFYFGIPTGQSQYCECAKDVLYNNPSIYEDEKSKTFYLKSHSLYEAGEQKKRGYQWPFDPKNHIFGRNGNMVLNEAKLCLQPETVQESFPKTLIVKKNMEDFKDFNYNTIGAPKNLGQTNSYLGPDHVFGYKPKNVEPWNAAKCIHGEPTINQVQPDGDLGKSIRHGFRNITKTGDEGRVFGVPTIRNDVKKPQQKSVADNFNYGDEPEAFELLNPERFHEMGVSRKDFEALRPKEEIRKLFANIGYSYKPGKFEGIFMRAQELCQTGEDYVSINGFLQAVREMDHIN